MTRSAEQARDAIQFFFLVSSNRFNTHFLHNVSLESVRLSPYTTIVPTLLHLPVPILRCPPEPHSIMLATTIAGLT